MDRGVQWDGRMKAPATANEVNRILGDVDPLVVERILATGASADEISEALSEVEDEQAAHWFHHKVASAVFPR